jgi:hypothetical protein
MHDGATTSVCFPQHSACAPSPASLGGAGRGEGVYPRVVCLWRRPSPRPSPRKSGERERRRPCFCFTAPRTRGEVGASGFAHPAAPSVAPHPPFR